MENMRHRQRGYATNRSVGGANYGQSGDRGEDRVG